jgi:phospholipase/carboxylesterase
MQGLVLRVEPKSVEPAGEPAPLGFATLECDGHRAILLTPDEIDPDRRYPLITVLHGAGRQDEAHAKAYRDEPERRQALFLIPRSYHPTWDLIAGAGRIDVEFLEYAYDLVYRRYPVDMDRQAIVGYSDGASYGLSIALSNPRIFRAVMAWAAGFVAVDPSQFDPAQSDDGSPRPDLLLEYGTHDQVFPFEQIAVPMRRNLEAAGYSVVFRVDEGGRHWPSGDFQPEALDWFFGLG